MLEIEGPTSVDTGITSCLLFNAEPVFRRLRDDLLEEMFLVGMTQMVVFKMQRLLDNASCSPMNRFETAETPKAERKWSAGERDY